MHIRRVYSLIELQPDLHGLEVTYKGNSLSTASLLRNKKLFMADYTFLDTVSLHRDFVFYSPQVLFSLDNHGSLDLFAILLRTDKGQKSHLITKLSPPNKILFAKMHVSMADAQSHEFMHHLAIHMMMEAVAIARNNYLSKTQQTFTNLRQIIFRKSYYWSPTGTPSARHNHY